MSGDNLDAQLFTGPAELRQHFFATISGTLPYLFIHYIDVLLIGIENARDAVAVDPLPQQLHR